MVKTVGFIPSFIYILFKDNPKWHSNFGLYIVNLLNQLKVKDRVYHPISGNPFLWFEPATFSLQANTLTAYPFTYLYLAVAN